jgi:translation initiation factor IF-1
MKTENIQTTGVVTECLAAYKFRVALPCGHECIAHLGGRLIKNYIRVTQGDAVEIELSPYDLTRGRITRREK